LRLKVDADLDDFEAEKDHGRIAAILGNGVRGLLVSPHNLQAVAKALAADFQGVSAAADYDRDGRLDIYFCPYAAYYQGARDRWLCMM